MLRELSQGQTSDSGLELGEVKGFCKVVVRAGLEPGNLVRDFTPRGRTCGAF